MLSTVPQNCNKHYQQNTEFGVLKKKTKEVHFSGSSNTISELTLSTKLLLFFKAAFTSSFPECPVCTKSAVHVVLYRAATNA